MLRTPRGAYRAANPLPGASNPRLGLTLVETVASVAIFLVLFVSIAGATLGINGAYLEGESISRLQLRAQIAMERVLELTGYALTTDAQFAPLRPSTGYASHGLRFRTISFLDPATGAPVYDDGAVVYIYGPDSGTEPSRGLIVGRGPTLADIYNAGKGADGLLGTTDDDTRTSLASGLPAVELLIPETFAPQTGDLFTVDVSPAPIGRLLTFTIRLNTRGKDGAYLLANDLVVTERIALKR